MSHSSSAMGFRTPVYNREIQDVLDVTSPGVFTCKGCGVPFEISLRDLEFHRMLLVPIATFCPMCRRIRRREFVNYTTLYRRKCDVPGHEEMLVSLIPSGARFPVYDFDYYWNGDWDSLSYGRLYDFSRSFFDQFFDLFSAFPQPASTRDPQSLRCDYTAYGLQNKDCYYLFGGMKSENVLYGNWPIDTKDCVDVFVSWSCERSYEIVHSSRCYASKFMYFCESCMHCAFMYDCRGCEDCFGCVHLKNKKYCFFNEQLTKEEYDRRVHKFDFGSRRALTIAREQFLQFLQRTPTRAIFNEKCVDSLGTLLQNCRDAYWCFFAIGSEHVRYTELNLRARDSMDMLLGTGPERVYYSILPYEGSDIVCSVNMRGQCMQVEYSMNLKGCKDCFGCIGLTNKAFCILNTQYTEDEYWTLVDRIKTHMLERKEYGEFFPSSCSPFPYNASLAQLLMPMSESEAHYRGLWWAEPESRGFLGKIYDDQTMPDHIHDVSDDVLQSAVRCASSSRLFNITRQELEFFRRERIALPIFHPFIRLYDRFRWVDFLTLKEGKCSKCGVTVWKSVHSEYCKIVYCEACYQAEVE